MFLVIRVNCKQQLLSFFLSFLISFFFFLQATRTTTRTTCVFLKCYRLLLIYLISDEQNNIQYRVLASENTCRPGPDAF